MNNEQVSALLKEMRFDLNFSQEKMASLLGVSSRTYQRYESGESEVGVSQLLRFIKQYDNDLFISLLSNLSGLEKPRQLERNVSGVIEIDPNAVAIKILELKSKSQTQSVRPLKREELPADHAAIRYPLTGYWDWNIDTNETYWSAEMFPVYGTKEGKIPSREEIKNIIYKEDLESVWRSFKHLLDDGVPYHSQHRTHFSEDSHFVVNASAQKTIQNGETVLYGYVKAHLVKDSH